MRSGGTGFEKQPPNKLDSSLWCPSFHLTRAWLPLCENSLGSFLYCSVLFSRFFFFLFLELPMAEDAPSVSFSLAIRLIATSLAFRHCHVSSEISTYIIFCTFSSPSSLLPWAPEYVRVPNTDYETPRPIFSDQLSLQNGNL